MMQNYEESYGYYIFRPAPPPPFSFINYIINFIFSNIFCFNINQKDIHISILLKIMQLSTRYFYHQYFIRKYFLLDYF